MYGPLHSGVASNIQHECAWCLLALVYLAEAVYSQFLSSSLPFVCEQAAVHEHIGVEADLEISAFFDLH